MTYIEVFSLRDGGVKLPTFVKWTDTLYHFRYYNKWDLNLGDERHHDPQVCALDHLNTENLNSTRKKLTNP